MTLKRCLPAGVVTIVLLTAPLHAEQRSADHKFKLQEVSLGYEAQHDRLRFNFHNPVPFDGTPIPHQYVQTYTADNHWCILRGRYNFLGLPLESEFGITPQMTNYGDDYDTQFEPSGNVSVGGTTGNVSMRSYEFRQRARIGKSKGVSISATYDYRLNRSRFQFGTSFETNTKPPSAVFEQLPIQETTKSRLHSIAVGGRRGWDLSSRWRVVGEVSFSPSTLAFLSTILPAKYPGEEIVSLAKAFGISSHVGLFSGRGRFPLEIYAEYGRSWSYSSSNDFRREFFGVGANLGIASHP